VNTLTQFQEQCTSKTTSLKFQKAYVKVGGEAWLLGWIICSCRRRRRRGANPLAAASLSPPSDAVAAFPARAVVLFSSRAADAARSSRTAAADRYSGPICETPP